MHNQTYFLYVCVNPLSSTFQFSSNIAILFHEILHSIKKSFLIIITDYIQDRDNLNVFVKSSLIAAIIWHDLNSFCISAIQAQKKLARVFLRVGNQTTPDGRKRWDGGSFSSDVI